MALSRHDQTKVKLEELDNLKGAMRGFNAERLAKAKHSSVEAPDAGDEEYGEHDPSLEEEVRESGDENDTHGVSTCPECGEEVEAGEMHCPHCGAEMGQEGGGEEDGQATDEEEGDADRLAALAEEKRGHR